MSSSIWIILLSNFRTQVEGLKTLKSHQGMLTVDLIAVFSDEWEQFKQAKSKAEYLLPLGHQASSHLFTKIEVDPSDKLYVIAILSEGQSHFKIEQLNKQGIGNDHSLEIKSSKDFVI